MYRVLLSFTNLLNLSSITLNLNNNEIENLGKGLLYPLKNLTNL